MHRYGHIDDNSVHISVIRRFNCDFTDQMSSSWAYNVDSAIYGRHRVGNVQRKGRNTRNSLLFYFISANISTTENFFKKKHLGPRF